MKKRLTILTDMDGIVVDFLQQWLDEYNEQYGRNVTKADITEWDLHKVVPDGKLIYSILHRPGFFEHLPVIPGALAALDHMLTKGHDVVFVSAATGNALKDKETWIKKYTPFMKNRLLLAWDKTPKYYIEGHEMIDDGPHNIIAYRQARPSAFITGIEYPYTAPGIGAANVLYRYEDTERAWANMLRDIDLLAEGVQFRSPAIAVEGTVVS